MGTKRKWKYGNKGCDSDMLGNRKRQNRKNTLREHKETLFLSWFIFARFSRVTVTFIFSHVLLQNVRNDSWHFQTFCNLLTSDGSLHFSTEIYFRFSFGAPIKRWMIVDDSWNSRSRLITNYLRPSRAIIQLNMFKSFMIADDSFSVWPRAWEFIIVRG